MVQVLQAMQKSDLQLCIINTSVWLITIVLVETMDDFSAMDRHRSQVSIARDLGEWIRCATLAYQGWVVVIQY